MDRIESRVVGEIFASLAIADATVEVAAADVVPDEVVPIRLSLALGLPILAFALDLSLSNSDSVRLEISLLALEVAAEAAMFVLAGLRFSLFIRLWAEMTFSLTLTPLVLPVVLFRIEVAEAGAIFSLDVVDTASELPLNIISRCNLARMSVEELLEPEVKSPNPLPVDPRPAAEFLLTARGSKKAPDEVISIFLPA